jgi:hypothetical protein
MWHGEFRHPRLVETYDAQFSWSREDDFFFASVNQTPSARVADLGGVPGGSPALQQLHAQSQSKPIDAVSHRFLLLASR